MRAPALQRLLLCCSPGHQHASSHALIHRFLESSPRVELLELYDVDLPREELEQCFILLPHLQELRLHDNDISDELQLLHGPTGLCPNLVRLDVRWCVHLTESALVQFVRSRVDATTDKPMSAFQRARAIEEVGTAIHCLHVKEKDVLDITDFTICRLVVQVIVRTADDFAVGKAVASTKDTGSTCVFVMVLSLLHLCPGSFFDSILIIRYIAWIHIIGVGRKLWQTVVKLDTIHLKQGLQSIFHDQNGILIL
jgi:hypothetical protein